VSKDGQRFILSMSVKPDCETLMCTAKLREKTSHSTNNKGNNSQVRIYDQLMVRHWDTWTMPYKEHLFSGHLNTKKQLNQAVDITAGWLGDIAGISQVSIHPDGSKLAFSAKLPAKDQAWTTNFDIFEVDLKTNNIINLTQHNKAWDASPTYSDNGRYLAYKTMSIAGYEADKFSIQIRENTSGRVKAIAGGWDRSVSSLTFSDDSRTLYVTAQDLGQKSIFEINPEFGDVRSVYSLGSAGDVSISGEMIYFTRHSLNTPKDIFSINKDGYGFKQLTDINKDKLANISFGEYQQFSFKGWNEEKVYGYWMKPANFEQGKSYPIAYLVHGGPQGSFSNQFHPRWNAQLWAAQGYGVVMIDFHGSTGYGQAFTHSISRDWGGKPLEDLQKGFNHIVEVQPWLDAERACALGASYGGYMMNWIAGNWPDGFNCLINHAGIYDLASFYQTTEELWFPEYDLGDEPWKSMELGKSAELASPVSDYRKFNPAGFAKRWKTPMLILQGELDYRIPYTQSLAAFTTLQRKGIDSRLVIFPNEDHHIRDPDNLKVWYQEVFTWLDRYTRNTKDVDKASEQGSIERSSQ
jgi:dipeptidyl aminopeptidase/acylaminoacyl peptidase